MGTNQEVTDNNAAFRGASAHDTTLMTTHFSSTCLVSLRRMLLAALGCALSLAAVTYAANPNQGTLNPGSAAALQWVGDAIGGPSVTTESTCQDGVNCDVFTIHLTGVASDYAGKQLVVKITFSMLSDYDLYVHKDAVNGKVVFPGGNGSQPGTFEQVVINPATSGAGDYVVHVTYPDVLPSDQYHGTATIMSAAITSKKMVIAIWR